MTYITLVFNNNIVRKLNKQSVLYIKSGLFTSLDYDTIPLPFNNISFDILCCMKKRDDIFDMICPCCFKYIHDFLSYILFDDSDEIPFNIDLIQYILQYDIILKETGICANEIRYCNNYLSQMNIEKQILIAPPLFYVYVLYPYNRYELIVKHNLGLNIKSHEIHNFFPYLNKYDNNLTKSLKRTLYYQIYIANNTRILINIIQNNLIPTIKECKILQQFNIIFAINYLFDCGVDMQFVNISNLIYYAYLNKNLAVIEILLKHNIDLCERFENQQSFLHKISLYIINHTLFYQLLTLLNKHCIMPTILDMQDIGGYTILHNFFLLNDVKSIEIVLLFNPTLTIKNKNNFDIYDYIDRINHSNYIRNMIHIYINIKFKDNDDNEHYLNTLQYELIGDDTDETYDSFYYQNRYNYYCNYIITYDRYNEDLLSLQNTDFNEMTFKGKKIYISDNIIYKTTYILYKFIPNILCIIFINFIIKCCYYYL